jgi:hypothetical protein
VRVATGIIACSIAALTALPTADSALRRHGIGDSITLRTTDYNGPIRVTLVKVVDPARSSYPSIRPRRGYRFVGIWLRLKNLGKTFYDDSPANGAFVIDTQRHRYRALPAYRGTIEPRLSFGLASGGSGTGVAAFEVPTRARIRIFTLKLAYPAGRDTGVWHLT